MSCWENAVSLSTATAVVLGSPPPYGNYLTRRQSFPVNLVYHSYRIDALELCRKHVVDLTHLRNLDTVMSYSILYAHRQAHRDETLYDLEISSFCQWLA